MCKTRLNLRFPGIMHLLLALVSISAWANKPSVSCPLFYVGRSLNEDIIVYELNTDENGNLQKEAPIRMYWLRKTENNRTEPLTWIQNKYSYGLKFIEGGNIPKGEYHFHFAGYMERTLVLKNSPKGYKVFTLINNMPIELSHIFIHITGGTFWVPTIPKVEIHGQDPKTGQKTVDVIYP
jgi:hypothetical protein